MESRRVNPRRGVLTQMGSPESPLRRVIRTRLEEEKRASARWRARGGGADSDRVRQHHHSAEGSAGSPKAGKEGDDKVAAKRNVPGVWRVHSGN